MPLRSVGSGHHGCDEWCRQVLKGELTKLETFLCGQHLGGSSHKGTGQAGRQSVGKNGECGSENKIGIQMTKMVGQEGGRILTRK